MNGGCQPESPGVCLVGDPVDVATGANTDRSIDFRLAGPLPLVWRRCYSSAQHRVPSVLGWGHFQEFSHHLLFDADGLRHESPTGTVTSFGPLIEDGRDAAQSGLVLERLSSLRYRLHTSDGWERDFAFTRVDRPAPMHRLAFGMFAVQLQYNDLGELTSLVDAAGRLLWVDHDTAGHIAAVRLWQPETNQNRVLVRYSYDTFGQLVELTDFYQNTQRFTYDGAGRMVSHTDRRGYTFRFAYAPDGRCIRTSGEDGLHEVQLRYLDAERISVVTEADGGEWVYVHHEGGSIVQVLQPDGGARNIEFDSSGRPTHEVSAQGAASTFHYDDNGGLVGSTTPEGDYLPAGETKARPDPTVQVTPVLQAMVGKRDEPYVTHRPSATRIRRSGTTPVEHEFGNLLAFAHIQLPGADAQALEALPAPVRKLVRLAKSPTGVLAPKLCAPPVYPPGEWRYDAAGVPLSHRDPDGHRQTWRYDAGGNIVSHRDRDGSEWRYDYHSWDLLQREVDPLGNATRYGWTTRGQLAALKDAGGTVREYRYSTTGNLMAVHENQRVLESYRFTVAHGLTEKLDQDGQSLFHREADRSNQTTALMFASGRRHTFQYDERHRLTVARTPDCNVQIAYDELGNRVADLRDGLGVTQRFHLFEVAETTVLGHFRTTYQRTQGEVRITDPAGGCHRVRFLSHGLLLKQLANGVQELSQYHWEGRCLVKAAWRGDATQRLWTRSYHYSGTGNLLSAEDSQAAMNEFGYDAAHRLVSSCCSDKEERYGYDAAGNLTRWLGCEQAVVGAGNQLERAGGEYFEYDARGCMKARTSQAGTTTYDYDELGLLAGCRTPLGELRVRRDGLGRRVMKTWRGESETHLYWDGDRVLGELLPIGALRVYVYTDAKALVPFLFVEYESVNAEPGSGRHYFIFTDQLGAPVRVENDAGEAVWRAVLSPYGAATVDPRSVISFHIRWPGHFDDAEVGLHENRFRTYEPALGRFLQPDPIDVEGGVNLYSYSARPTSEVDTNGLCANPPKPFEPNEESQAQAAALAEAIRARLKVTKTHDRPWKRELKSGEVKEGVRPVYLHDNVTYAVMVVRMKDGSRRTVVIASGTRRYAHRALGGLVYDYVWPKKSPPGNTGKHAEQRGLEWARTTPEVAAVEAISPTRACCSGCTRAIQAQGDPHLHIVRSVPGEPRSLSFRGVDELALGAHRDDLNCEERFDRPLQLYFDEHGNLRNPDRYFDELRKLPFDEQGKLRW